MNYTKNVENSETNGTKSKRSIDTKTYINIDTHNDRMMQFIVLQLNVFKTNE